MNINTKVVSYKLLRTCRRFVNVKAKQRDKPGWIKPTGHETGISIYNPITKCKVPLVLKHENVLTWYMCGPTVYDSSHIGHATTYVKSDIVQRILSDYFNINVLTVMGITDIDDKIIRRASELQLSFQELTKRYEREFFNDIEMLNVRKPYMYCRVSDYVPEIIAFVQNILNKGGAYISSNGSVYFDTQRCSNYGKLSVPANETAHSEKKSALDFALWKAKKENEPSWESPWGHGRPGWHIECSAIASLVFGNSVDIHSGGIDLAFPHHENEEAQSCCYHETDQWVNYWFHCGHLHLKGDVKMSKSLKNTVSIQEYLQTYTGNQFRILCLLSNYRNGIEFSDEVMVNAIAILKKLETFISDCDNYVAGKWTVGNIDEVALFHCLEETKKKIHEALLDNFDTTRCMNAIMELVNTGNKMLHQIDNKESSRNPTAIASVSNYISSMLSKFGIAHTTSTNKDYDMNEIINSFVKFRSIVRNRLIEEKFKDKVLADACDQVRKDLAVCGITVKDIKNTSVWSIKRC